MTEFDALADEHVTIWNSREQTGEPTEEMEKVHHALLNCFADAFFESGGDMNIILVLFHKFIDRKTEDGEPVFSDKIKTIFLRTLLKVIGQRMVDEKKKDPSNPDMSELPLHELQRFSVRVRRRTSNALDEETDNRVHNIANQLISKIPPELEEFARVSQLSDVHALSEALHKMIERERPIRLELDKPSKYGFKGSEDMNEKLKMLIEPWSDTIKVTIKGDIYPIRMVFEMVTPQESTDQEV